MINRFTRPTPPDKYYTSKHRMNLPEQEKERLLERFELDEIGTNPEIQDVYKVPEDHPDKEDGQVLAEITYNDSYLKRRNNALYGWNEVGGWSLWAN